MFDVQGEREEEEPDQRLHLSLLQLGRPAHADRGGGEGEDQQPPRGGAPALHHHRPGPPHHALHGESPELLPNL